MLSNLVSNPPLLDVHILQAKELEKSDHYVMPAEDSVCTRSSALGGSDQGVVVVSGTLFRISLCVLALLM